MSGLSPSKDSEILQLESRRKIYDLVKEFSGCNFHELERRTSIAPTTLQYHLHYLTKHGLITLQKDGNKIRYFIQHLQPEDKRLLVFLRQQNIRHLLLFILTHKTCRQKDLVEFLQLSPSTISLYLSRLIASKVLQTVTKGKELSYQLAIVEDDLVTLLITYKASFFDQLVDQTIEMWNFK
ncbi:transcriptional regulator [Candidatus Woesearchaeota archaeon]|nr:transcriptional regulator [Candidatus Woesearchaeota archaeon]